MSDDKRNLETIPKGSLGLIPLASCKELGEKVDPELFCCSRGNPWHQ